MDSAWGRQVFESNGAAPMSPTTAVVRAVAADGATTKQIVLPPGWCLHGLPSQLVRQFERIAKRLICMRLSPIVWLRWQGRRRRAIMKTVRPATDVSSIMNLLQASDLLRTWPATLLAELADKAVPMVFRSREIIIHEGETSASGLFVLAQGQVEILKKLPNAPKGIDETKLASTARSGQVLGDFSVLNEEPRAASVVVASDFAVVFCVPRTIIAEKFQQLPLTVAQPLLALAYEKRTNNMPQCFPMSEPRVRMASIFRKFPREGIQIILPRLIPRVVPRGQIVCEKDKQCTEMFFVRRGVVSFSSGSHGTRVNTLMKEGACFGERELLFHERYPYTLVAQSNVDLYLLRDNDLESVLSSHEELRALAQKAGSAQREVKLNQQRQIRDELSRYIANIPLLAPFLTTELIEDLRQGFSPRVVNTRQLLVSTAEQCDRLVIMTRGSAAVRDVGVKSYQLQLGECIGYTCMFQHKWRHSVVTLEPVDAWELPREAFYKVLKTHRVLEKVVGVTQQLLQPLLPNPRAQDWMEAIALRVPDPNSFDTLHTPNMHPTSMEDTKRTFLRWTPKRAVIATTAKSRGEGAAGKHGDVEGGGEEGDTATGKGAASTPDADAARPQRPETPIDDRRVVTEGAAPVVVVDGYGNLPTTEATAFTCPTPANKTPGMGKSSTPQAGGLTLDKKGASDNGGHSLAAFHALRRQSRLASLMSFDSAHSFVMEESTSKTWDELDKVMARHEERYAAMKASRPAAHRALRMDPKPTRVPAPPKVVPTAKPVESEDGPRCWNFGLTGVKADRKVEKALPPTPPMGKKVPGVRLPAKPNYSTPRATSAGEKYGSLIQKLTTISPRIRWGACRAECAPATIGLAARYYYDEGDTEEPATLEEVAAPAQDADFSVVTPATVPCRPLQPDTDMSL